MANDRACKLCGKPAEFHSHIIPCEACEKELNKAPERLPELAEQPRITRNIQLEQGPYPKLITKRRSAFLIDGLLVATISLLLGGGFWWLIAIGYLLVRDALISGRSVGKFVIGLTTMDHEGNACTLTKSILRNVLLFVPGVVVEFFVMAFSKCGWRLRDRLAKTQVIDFQRPIRGAWILLPALFLTVLGMTQKWHWRDWPDFLDSKKFSIGTILNQGTKDDRGTIDVQYKDSLEGTERYIIHFRDGHKIAAEAYWDKGDEIKYQRLGGIIGVPRNKIAVIESTVDGSLKQYNPFLTKQ